MKVIEIEACQQCPNFDYGPRTCLAVSDEEIGKPVPSRHSIPEWCPLDSPEEYSERNFNIDKEL